MPARRRRRQPRVVRVPFILLLVVALAGGALFAVPSLRHLLRTPATTTTAPTTTTTVHDVSLNAPITSPAIIAENARPGTTAWHITPGASPTAIQGFATTTDAAPGSIVHLYVSSEQPHFRVEAFRMGWYQGKGARLVWVSPPETGVVQPACGLDTTVNMVSCTNWSLSVSVPITSAFVPGDYLLKLDAGPSAQSYILLTVWDPSSTATYVIMNRSLVEQGWNTYGGYSFYAGVGPCIIDSSSYPVCNRARVVSFDRPYDTSYGSSDFLTNEYPLVALAEREGLDVTYITDITLSEHPTLLAQHRALLDLDHDESWTYAERLAVQNAQVSHGLNVVYFGAAAMVRHVRLEPSILGPDQQEVDYRNSYEDPLLAHGNPMQVTGNTWESPPSSWSPLSQIGTQYSGYLSPGNYVPMTVSDPTSWVFAGTGLTQGSSIPNAIASDVNHVIASGSTPSNMDVLTHSAIPMSAGTLDGQWGGYSYSDMVYFTLPSGAGVINTGNNVWIGDLLPCATTTSCPAPLVTKITENILAGVGHGPLGTVHPPHPNLSSIVPYGS